MTLTELDDKLKAKLPPAVRDNVVILKGAKANHDAKAPTRYFMKETPSIDVLHEDGRSVSGRTVVMVPFKPNFGWDADSDNAKIAVLHAIADAEKPTDEHPAGQPLRVKTHGDIKGAADLVAEQEDAERSAVETTIKALEAQGFLERAAGPRSKAGHRPTIWRVTADGGAWLEMKQSVLTTVDDYEAEATPEPIDDPAGLPSETETESGTLAGLEEINFG